MLTLIILTRGINSPIFLQEKYKKSNQKTSERFEEGFFRWLEKTDDKKKNGLITYKNISKCPEKLLV
jgi:hypothetical protein